MLIRKHTVLVAFFVVVSQLIGISYADAQVSGEIHELIENNRVSNAFWSIQVRDLSGTLLEDLNGDKLMRPASNLKLVSSAAFLEYLGPGFQFETTLFGRGHQQADTWIGDIIIKGDGDPAINRDFYNGNAFFVFEKWADVLLSRGITTIEGNLIGFDGLFDDIPYPKGWEWDDLTFYYAPEISALSFNSNAVDLEVIANGPVGSIPQISWFPMNTPYVEFVNEQIITPPGTDFDESYVRMPGTNIIFLRSTLPQGYHETESLTITAPSYYFLDTFQQYLEERGISVTGRLYVDSDYFNWSESGLEALDKHISVPLHKYIEELNVESNNFYAEMILKKMASEVYDVQGNTELGLGILKEYMHSTTFDTSSVSLRDASGMAPATLVQTSDLNRFLVDITHKDYYEYFFNSLSVGGLNGTLKYRFRNSTVNGNFNGKTGFVSGVRALSGYLDTKSEKKLAVTIITNNYTTKTSHVDFVHEKILEFLYENY